MKTASVLGLVLTFGMPALVAAEPTLTYETVLRLARENSPTIRIAEAQLAEAEAGFGAARALRSPSVSLSAGYQRLDDDLNLTAGDPESWNAELQANYRVYSGGNVSGLIDQARARLSAAEASFQTTLRAVLLGVKEAWFGVLVSGEEIGVREEAVRLLEEQLQLVQSRFEAGAVSRFELLRAQVALANARPPLIRARNAHELAIVQLLRAIGMQADQPATAQIKGSLEFSPFAMSLSQALALARQNRPEFQANQFLLAAAEAEIRSAKAGKRPTLDLVAGYGFQRSPFSSSLDDALDGWRVGVQGRWNIWDNRATDSAVRAANARLRQVEVSIDELDLQVATEVRQALLAIEEATALVEASRMVAEQAKEALQLARDRFAVGSAIQVEVLETQVALTEARTNEVQALYAYNLALARFDRAVGR